MQHGNDEMTTFFHSYSRLVGNLKLATMILAARSTVIAEPYMAAMYLRGIEAAENPPDEWHAMYREAVESGVDVSDREAFDAFQRAWWSHRPTAKQWARETKKDER